jgi:FKBP-type peptidyl-prolyl cis-trans isomerase
MYLRIFITVLVLFSLFINIAEAQNKSKTKAEPASSSKIILKTTNDSCAYAIGMNSGMAFKRDSLFFDVDIIRQGMYDYLYGDTSKVLMNQQQATSVLMGLQQKVMGKQQAKQSQTASKNKSEGEAFLAANKKNEGVKTTASGLQYKVIKEGTGKAPTDKDTVTVHYTGKLIDGTTFDSSVERGQPATFSLGGVIKGWTEGLQLMKEGGKTTFYIPSELGYGMQAPPKIGPNAVLIFDVELIKVGK